MGMVAVDGAALVVEATRVSEGGAAGVADTVEDAVGAIEAARLSMDTILAAVVGGAVVISGCFCCVYVCMDYC